MAEIRTNESLLEALRRATSTSLTRDQIERQRLSFVMGALPTDNNMTRAEVKQILEQQKGIKASAG